MRPQPDFIHEFVPGTSNRTLLLLHGTGGNERDLIPLGRELDPNAALLSPRGKVLENGMPRFFRRLAEGVFDLEDLKTRTNELADFVAAAVRHYELAADDIVAVSVIRTVPTSPQACYCFARKSCTQPFYFAPWCRSCPKTYRTFHPYVFGSALGTRIQSFQHRRLGAWWNFFVARERMSQFDFLKAATN